METAITFRIFSNIAIGLAFIAYCVVMLAFTNKRYFFKPIEYLRPRAGGIAFAAGVLYLLMAVLLMFERIDIAVGVHIFLAVLVWVLFFSLFNYKRAKGDISVSKDIEYEINSRYSIEDKLINKNKQLEWAEKTAKICYCSWDLRKDEIQFSDGAEDIFGIQAQKAYKFDNLKALVIPEDRIKIQRFIDSVNEAKEMSTLQFRTIVDGRLRYIQMNGEVFDTGKPMSLIRGTFQDVTEQQMFIKRIEDKNETLKTIAWTQSHEVRGPLATIMGLVDLLDEEDFHNGQNKEIVRGLKESSAQLDDIIRKVVKKTESIDVDLS